MKRKQSMVAALLVLLLSVSPAMAKTKKFGKGVPKKASVTKLSEIIKEPQKFKDKEVVLQGNFVNICCATDFVYREGLESIEIYPQDFPIPKLDKGKPIKIWGVVRIIEKESAESDSTEAEESSEVEESSEAEEFSEESWPIIYFDALGMEAK